jgi:predicted nucleotide-binding protein (sugar kinase/HSP70/actin superfamily)
MKGLYVMENKIKVGIPRALLYHKYECLWKEFFRQLGVDILISPKTNKKILENGKKLSMDEACLSLKIFMGHVDYLKDKVDYILIPRITSLEKNMKLCTNFSALYDIARNTFNIKILNYNVDVDKKIYEEDSFIKMGTELGFSKSESLEAYKNAKKEDYKNKKVKYLLQNKKLKTDKTKVLLVSHAYNLNDNLVGNILKEILEELDVVILDGDIYNIDKNNDLYKNISSRLYWTYNQELLNSICEYKDYVDGIILLSTFPCGPDSLVNDMCLRKLNIPTINILFDEQASKEGLQTRLESFIDIIKKEDIYE